MGRCLCLLLLLTFAAAAGEERAEAVITMSDGSTLSGEVRVMGTRPLTLNPEGSRHRQPVRLADLRRIEHFVENAGMERPWTFKESGRHEKYYFDGEYPLLNFGTRFHLVDGRILQGHLLSAILIVYTDDGKERVFLKRQIRGDKGEALSDFVWPASVHFPEHGKQAAKRLQGRVRGFGKLVSVRALDVKREQLLAARVEGERFDFGKVLPGPYDVFVQTGTHALVGVSDTWPDKVAEAEPLQEQDLAAVREAFAKADDFFNDRWVLSLHGQRNYAKALVYKRRADYYASGKHTPGGFLWHVDLWGWRKVEDEWKLDKRWILIRRKQTGREQNRRLYTVPALAGAEPGTPIELRGPEPPEPWQFVRELD